jgi:hypothetical protein
MMWNYIEAATQTTYRDPRQFLGSLLGNQTQALHDLDGGALEVERVKVQALDASVEQLPTHLNTELDTVGLDFLVVVLRTQSNSKSKHKSHKQVRKFEGKP